ncbi:hypothetical protein D918_00784, partial [Trichuris suis]
LLTRELLAVVLVELIGTPACYLPLPSFLVSISCRLAKVELELACWPSETNNSYSDLKLVNT